MRNSMQTSSEGRGGGNDPLLKPGNREQMVTTTTGTEQAMQVVTFVGKESATTGRAGGMRKAPSRGLCVIRGSTHPGPDIAGASPGLGCTVGSGLLGVCLSIRRRNPQVFEDKRLA